MADQFLKDSVQCQSVPDQREESRGIKWHWTAMIGIERYFGSMSSFWSVSIGIGQWSRESCQRHCGMIHFINKSCINGEDCSNNLDTILFLIWNTIILLRDISLRGHLGVRDALFHYLWKQSISEVICLESPYTYTFFKRISNSDHFPFETERLCRLCRLYQL